MASSYLNDSLRERRGFTNFIRLAAAFAVLVSHSNPLSGVGADPSFGESPLGEIAVSVFFVLSGYFVFSSSLNHRFRTFAVLRVARLFPALIAVNFILAFILGPSIAYLSNQENYWRSAHSPFSFLLFNSVLAFGLQPRLAELLDQVPFPFVVNGSLWTLPIELKCYVLCAIVALLVKIVRAMVPLYFLVIASSLLYLLGVQGNFWLNENLPISTLRLVLIFFTGALVSKINFSYLNQNPFLLLLAFLGFIAILWSSDLYVPFFYWILVPTIAFTPTRVALAFDFLRSRDFSYGFYLWAFPIQQFVMYFDIANGSISLIILSSLITLVFSITSWYLVEFPAMKFARKLLKEN